MARWMIQAANAVMPLMKLLNSKLLESDYIRMDETPLQVLNEAGKTAQSKSYMWVRVCVSPSKIILFDYSDNRSSENPKKLLEGFKGYLQVDGYDGYAPVCNKEEVTRVGCFAHARRKFFTAFKSSSGNSTGKQGLIFIKKLYQIEEEIKDLAHEVKLEKRKSKSKPILEEFKEFLDDKKDKVAPKSLAGKAVCYALNEWEYLSAYTQNGSVNIDNNLVESRIRPFTIGRKNWLFSATPKGAHASAILYSLVETAKLNGLDPFEYLSRVFEQIPLAKNREDFMKLLTFPASA